MLKELVKRNRSYRRFFEDHPVSVETLRGLVDLARQTASAANRQPLKYMLSNANPRNEGIFDCLAWAAYIKEWKGPAPGERPAAYIIMLGDKDIADNYWCDPGIAAQTILLGAVEQDLGGCILGAIQKDKLRKSLEIPDRYEILYVLALGKPRETVVLEPLGADGDIKYWRGADDIHHVPKRSLDEIIVD